MLALKRKRLLQELHLPMLIFEIVPSLYPIGGAESLVLSLSKYFSSKSNKVVIVSLYNVSSEFNNAFFKKNNIKIIFLNKKRGIDFRCAKELKRIINEQKPDICHLHLDTYITFFLSGALKTQPNFYTLHTSVTKETFGSILKPRNFLLKKMFKKQYIYPVSISNIIDREVCSYFGNQKNTTIFNGVDTTTFTYQPTKPKKYTFISIGRMIELKNNLRMIKCFELFQQKHPESTYLIIGDGDKREECINYCKNKNIKNITFIKETNDVPGFLHQAKCLLLASRFEGNPMVINEAISCGVWIIASSVGGIPDIIDDSCGYLSNPESDDSFLCCMESFYLNRDAIINKTIPSSIAKNRQRVSIIRTGDEYLKLFRDSQKYE